MRVVSWNHYYLCMAPTTPYTNDLGGREPLASMRETVHRIRSLASQWSPAQFEGRNLYVHNPTVTLMRTTPEECAELGREIGRKLSAAQGPTAVFVPLRGVSMIAVAGQPFHDDAADEALFSALRASLDDSIELNERDTDINDPELAVEMADRLHALIEAAR